MFFSASSSPSWGLREVSTRVSAISCTSGEICQKAPTMAKSEPMSSRVFSTQPLLANMLAFRQQLFLIPGSGFPQKNWMRGSQRNMNGQSEDCLALLKINGEAGFDDMSCSGIVTSAKTLCKIHTSMD